ncbi:MAG: hypothetical protein H6819_12255 [Phycisphaerales bacterium]|nr:hypothetical protein [Phycisphaerales bacterium]MCB9857527.1 hypothetical protein [Phycisphaerales bacterium]MCB9864488.1 hypothetical protein [Phycisphaerales bacterium]
MNLVRNSFCARGNCLLTRLTCFSVLLAGVASTCAGDFFYQACGELVNTGGIPDCIVHVADDGTTVRPSDLAGFDVGDRVVVSGTISGSTASICDLTVTPNLSVTTIDRCFAECGTLVDSGGCLRFESDRGGAFLVVGSDAFEPGDRVFVSGPGTDGAGACNGEDLPNVAFPTIAECTEATGRIVNTFGCTYLLTGDGRGFDFFTIRDFSVGDYVTIAGDASSGQLGPCNNPLLFSNSILPAFGGPGTLVDTPDCGLVFQADEGNLGIRYALQNLGAFTAGDRVVVTGRIDANCNGGACSTPCLTDNTIGALSTVCGSIDLGSTNCLVFTPDDGGESFLIEHVEVIPQGATAFVAGTFRPNPGICDNEDNLPVMRDNLFQRCVDVCGDFQMGFECTPLFFGDDGGIYNVENTGYYTLGDRAHVRGGYDPSCNNLCPFPCIRANTIGPCDEIPGDVNGDGDVDIDDVQLFVAVLLGVDSDPYRVLVSDVNVDGTPDGKDVQPFTLIVLGFQ